MPVFITIQGETCFITCPDTFPHTSYERQISPFMPHWPGTWSWVIKTNRGKGTQNRTVERRDGKQKERRVNCKVTQGYFAALLGDPCCFFFFFFNINLFIYFWLHWVFIAESRLSLVVSSEGYFSLWCAGFSLQWLLLLWSTGSRCVGFSSCGTQAQ